MREKQNQKRESSDATDVRIPSFPVTLTLEMKIIMTAMMTMILVVMFALIIMIWMMVRRSCINRETTGEQQQHRKHTRQDGESENETRENITKLR